MKAAVLSCLLGMANARFKYIQKDANYLMKKIDPTNRNFMLGETGTLYNGYGCWCYFDDAVGSGRGQPIDLLDAECRLLHQCYECVVEIFTSQGQECEPWTVAFTPAANFATNSNEGYLAMCVQVNLQGGPQGASGLPNRGLCGTYACSCELRFAESIVVAFGFQTANTPAFSHAQGFNPITGCPLTKGYHDPTKECCGTPPYTFPYKTLPNTQGVAQKECCGSTVYPINKQLCCDGVSYELTKANTHSCCRFRYKYDTDTGLCSTTASNIAAFTKKEYLISGGSCPGNAPATIQSTYIFAEENPGFIADTDNDAANPPHTFQTCSSSGAVTKVW